MVSLTHPNPQIFYKTQTGVFSICGFQVKSLVNKNCRDLRTIALKLGPVTKLDERNKTMSIKFDDDTVSTIYHHCYFCNILPISSNSGTGFGTHSL